MSPLPLYLDTSALGGYFDDGWDVSTRELWVLRAAGKYRFLTSKITVQELLEAPEQVQNLFKATFSSDALLPLSPEIEQLAQCYISYKVLTPKYVDDARHVATCTVAGIEHLVSWNFRHMVNVDRAKGFNAVNLLQGYRPLSIVTPLQLIYGNETQEL